MRENEESDIDSIIKNMPKMVDFYPSPQVLTKLAMRAIQIKNCDKELWKGFKQVIRNDGTFVWKPIEFM